MGDHLPLIVEAFVEDADSSPRGAESIETLATIAAALAASPKEAAPLLVRHRLAQPLFAAAISFAGGEAGADAATALDSLEHATHVLSILAPAIDAPLEACCGTLVDIVDKQCAALIAIAHAPPPQSQPAMLAHARVRLYALQTLFASARDAARCAVLASVNDGAVPRLCSRVLLSPSSHYDIEATRVSATLLRNLCLPAETSAFVSRAEVMDGMLYCAAMAPDPSAGGATAAAARHVLRNDPAAARRLIARPDAVLRFVEKGKAGGKDGRRMHPVVRVEVARLIAHALVIAAPQLVSAASTLDAAAGAGGGAADADAADAGAGAGAGADADADAGADTPADASAAAAATAAATAAAAEAAALDALSSVDGVELLAFLLASDHDVLHAEACDALRQLRRLCASTGRTDPLDIGATVTLHGAAVTLRDRLAGLGDVGTRLLADDAGDDAT